MSISALAALAPRSASHDWNRPPTQVVCLQGEHNVYFTFALIAFGFYIFPGVPLLLALRLLSYKRQGKLYMMQVPPPALQAEAEAKAEPEVVVDMRTDDVGVRATTPKDQARGG